MDAEKIDTSEQLAKIANSMFSHLDQELPKNEADRKAFLLNLIRTIDFFSISQELPKPEEYKIGTDLVVLNGWNLVLSNIVDKFSNGAIYNTRFTSDIYQDVLKFCHLYGRANIVKILSQLIKFKEFDAVFEENCWLISRSKGISDPYLSDNYEFKKSEAFKHFLDNNRGSVNGWVAVDNVDKALNKIGNFHQRAGEFPGKSLYRDDLEERISSLVRPFDTGNGIMTGYDASPETDAHFIALATQLTLLWKGEVGLHPEIVIGGYKISQIIEVVVLIISLHLKHIQFCIIASKKISEISLPQSLTIWTLRADLIASICELSDGRLALDLVSDILNIVTFKKEDTSNLAAYPHTFIPLLIDMGDEMLLRPVSSVARNPLHAVKAMLHWRFLNATNLLGAPRENWLRDDIYNLFRGNRYFCTPGNVKLRENGKILTDVDGAVFDVVTGELGLFQFKWQDYSMANKKELRSRAKNLSKEMDNWGEIVLSWIKKSSILDVAQNFKIPLSRNFPKSIFLFGVSRNVARTQGYGAITEHGAIALSNFAQFTLARMEIGPTESVLGRMHERLFAEMDAQEKFQPLPTEFAVWGNLNMKLPDFFYRIDDK